MAADDLYRTGVHAIIYEATTPVPTTPERLTAIALKRVSETVSGSWKDTLEATDCSTHPWYQVGRNWVFRAMRNDVEQLLADDGSELRAWAIDVLRRRQSEVMDILAAMTWGHPDADAPAAMRRGAQNGVQEFLSLAARHRQSV